MKQDLSSTRLSSYKAHKLPQQMKIPKTLPCKHFKHNLPSWASDPTKIGRELTTVISRWLFLTYSGLQNKFLWFDSIHLLYLFVINGNTPIIKMIYNTMMGFQVLITFDDIRSLFSENYSLHLIQCTTAAVLKCQANFHVPGNANWYYSVELSTKSSTFPFL